MATPRPMAEALFRGVIDTQYDRGDLSFQIDLAEGVFDHVTGLPDAWDPNSGISILEHTRQTIENSVKHVSPGSLTKYVPRIVTERLVTRQWVAAVIAHEFDRLGTDDVARLANLIRGEESQQRSCSRLLLILVLIDRVPDIVWFIEANVNDACLPAQRNDTRDTFQIVLRRRHPLSRESIDLPVAERWSRPTRENFLIWSYAIYPPYFKSSPGKIVNLILDSSDAIPFSLNEAASQRMRDYEKTDWFHDPLSTVKLSRDARGGINEVTPVVIDPLQYNFGSYWIDHPAHHFALKVLHDPDAWRHEVSNLLRPENHTEKHVIKVLAAYEMSGATSGPEYGIIFPLAKCDLRQFWASHQDVSQKDMTKTSIWLAEQVFRVTEALASIHMDDSRFAGSGSNKNLQDIWGRHGDLKAANLLVFSKDHGPESSNDLESLSVFIADLGFSRYSRTTSRSYGSSMGVTSTYRPPEVDAPGNKLSRLSDIWSLGCTILEWVTAILEGWHGVSQTFSEERMECNPFNYNIEEDNFFRIDRVTQQPEVKPQVLKFIQRLKLNPLCTPYIHSLLDLTQEKMLRPIRDHRESSSNLAIELKHLWESYKSIQIASIPPLAPPLSETDSAENFQTLTDSSCTSLIAATAISGMASWGSQQLAASNIWTGRSPALMNAATVQQTLKSYSPPQPASGMTGPRTFEGASDPSRARGEPEGIPAEATSFQTRANSGIRNPESAQSWHSTTSTRTSSDSPTTTDDELEEPDSEEAEKRWSILDQLMEYFFLTLSASAVPLLTTTNGGSQDSTSNRSGNQREPSTQNAQPSGSFSGAGRTEQTRGDGEGQQGGDDRDGRDNDSEGREGINAIPRRYGCPYHKRSPRRFTCSKKGYSSTTRMKEHLLRVHAEQHHCPRCFAIFKTHNEKESHGRRDDPRCAVKEPPRWKREDPLDPDKQSRIRIRRKKNVTEDEHWRQVYLIIFPSDNPRNIPSPYHSNPGDVDQFEESVSAARSEYERFVEEELPRRIYQEYQPRITQEAEPQLREFLDDLPNVVRNSLINLTRAFEQREDGAAVGQPDRMVVDEAASGTHVNVPQAEPNPENLITHHPLSMNASIPEEFFAWPDLGTTPIPEGFLGGVGPLDGMQLGPPQGSSSGLSAAPQCGGWEPPYPGPAFPQTGTADAALGATGAAAQGDSEQAPAGQGPGGSSRPDCADVAVPDSVRESNWNYLFKFMRRA